MSKDRAPLSEIDLATLVEALDDHSEWSEWWFDPTNGQTELSMDPSIDGIEDDLDTEHMVRIEPQPSRLAYQDMVDFAEAVADPRASGLLLRALEGKGAFRRFRDTLYDLDELGLTWRDFSQLAAEQRALVWLEVNGLADPDELEQAIEDRRQRANALLTELAAQQGPQFDRDDVGSRWPEIAAHLDSGRSVTLTSDGRPWAHLQPADDR